MVIGEAPLTKDLQDVTDVDLKTVNTISILAIFIIIMVVFKSISLPFILLMSDLSLITPYEHYSYQRFPEVWHLPHYCPAWKEVTCQYCSNSSDCYFHELPGKALPDQGC